MAIIKQPLFQRTDKDSQNEWRMYSTEEQAFYQDMFRSYTQKKVLQWNTWRETSLAINSKLWETITVAALSPDTLLVEDPTIFKIWRTRVGSVLNNLYSAELQSQNATPSTTSNPLDTNNLQSLSAWSEYFTDIINTFQGTEDYKNWIGDAIAYGNGFLSVSWDSFKNSNKEKISFHYLKPTQVFQDPNATSLHNCDWIATVKRTTRTSIKAAFPQPEIQALMNDKDAKLREVAFEWDFFSDNIENQPTIMTDYNTELVDLITRYERVVKAKRYQIKMSYYAGFHLLTSKYIDIDEYPIVPLYEFKDGTSFWGSGTVSSLVPTQKAINVAKTLIHQQLTRNSVAILCASREGGVTMEEWQQALQSNNALVLLDNLENVPKFIVPPVISEEAVAISTAYKDDISSMAGASAVYEGERAGEVSSASGVNMLINRSQLSDNHLKHSLTDSITRLYKILRAYYASYGQSKFNASIRTKNLAAGGQKSMNVQLETIALKGDIVVVPVTSPMDGASKERDYQQLLQIVGTAANNPAFQDDLKGISLIDLVEASSISNKGIIEQNILNQQSQVLQAKAIEITQMVSQAFMMQYQANQQAQQPGGVPQGQAQPTMDVQQVVGAVAQLIGTPLADFPQVIQNILQQFQQEQQAQQQSQGGQPGPVPQQGGSGQGAGAAQSNAIMAQNGQTPQTSTRDYQQAKQQTRAQMGGGNQ